MQVESASKFILSIIENYDLFQNVYETLYDDTSKKIYSDDIKRKILYSELSTFVVDDVVPHSFTAQDQRRENIFYKVDPNSLFFGSINCDVQNFGFINNYVLDNIFPNSIPDSPRNIAGGVVFDVGSFNGATAIKFSKLVGEDGKVFTFEPLKTFYEDIQATTAPYGNINAYNIGFGDKPCSKKMCMNEGFSCLSDEGSYNVEIDTIDNFVSRHTVPTINLIKMDIEGQELNALHGGINTIRNYRPALAICIYHNDNEDMLTIPLFIKKNLSDYRIYIRKYHFSHDETVAYALPEELF